MLNNSTLKLKGFVINFTSVYTDKKKHATGCDINLFYNLFVKVLEKGREARLASSSFLFPRRHQ